MTTVLDKISRRIGSIFHHRGERRHRLVGRVDQWQMKREFQIHFLKGQGLEPKHTLLDLGCGTLRGGIPLIGYLDVGRYCGVEARAQVLAEAKLELQEHRLEHKLPRLIGAEDLLAVDLDTRFDFIWAFSVLFHMEDRVLDGAIRFVSSHLKRSGCFYANVNVGARNERNWQGFPLVWRPLDFYRECCARHALNICDMGPLRDFGHRCGDQQDEQHMLRITPTKA